PSRAAAAPRARADGGLVRFRLPRPSGPYPVGTVALRLVDTARPDPWVAARPFRELMVSVRYPARDVGGYPFAPHMLPGEAAGWVELNSLWKVPAERVDWAATRTHAHEGAPAGVRGGPYPVVLYSPGAGDPRSLGTTLCDDLASRGYVVVSIDHTYDASAVEFPHHRVEKSVLPAEYDKVKTDQRLITELLHKTVDVRVADTLFVLDVLRDALPRPLRAVADLGRIGMFGQSGGGFTALQAMHDDPRIAAGANFDGVVSYVQDDGDAGNLSSLATDGLDRPFLLVGKDGNTRDSVPSWDALWGNSRGWHRGLSLTGAEHATFTDLEVTVPQLAGPLGLTHDTVVANVGGIPPADAVAADRAYLAAFFDRWLRGKDDGGLLDGPSDRYPLMTFFS
ncbi:MAG TPA: hydrolase, partial [Streptomyces sp.]